MLIYAWLGILSPFLSAGAGAMFLSDASLVRLCLLWGLK